MVEEGVVAFHFSESKFSLSPFGASMVQVETKEKGKGYYLHSHALGMLCHGRILMLSPSSGVHWKTLCGPPTLYCSPTQEMLTHLSLLPSPGRPLSLFSWDHLS